MSEYLSESAEEFIERCKHFHGGDRRVFSNLKADLADQEAGLAGRMLSIVTEMKADGREKLHASENRAMNACKDLMGRVKEAYFEALEREQARSEGAQANRARLDASASNPSQSAPAVRMPSLREYEQIKSQSTNSDPAGGYLVTPQYGAFFDRMRPSNVVLAAGPMTVVIDNSDRIVMPGLNSSTTVYTPGEAGTITASDLALKTVTITAKKYACRSIASSELLADSNPGAREILAADHMNEISNRLDADMLEGDGTGGAIAGMRVVNGATTTSLGTNGATVVLNDIEGALYRLEKSNAELDRIALFMHPRSWSTLRKQLDGQNRYQLQPDPTADARRQLFGFPVFVSSQISIARTVGSSVDCSNIYAADMSKVVVAHRQDVGVLMDPYSRSGTDEVVINTITRWGFAVLHSAAVEIISGVRA